MSFDDAFLDFMPHTITVFPLSSFNEYAEATFSTSGSTYDAMVEERPDVIRSAFGDEIVSSHVVYVASTARISLSSRVVLPDGTEPPLVRSDVFSDEDGSFHHNVLFFGSGSAGG